MEFTKQQKENLQNYENAKLQIKELEEKINELKPEIIGLIPEGKELEGEFGNFFIQNKVTWKFSETVNTVEKQLKDMKKEEQAKGDAQSEKTPVLYYKVKK